MDGEIESAVTDWDTRRVAGGYDGLRELASGEFSGAVTEGTAWLFFTNGRIVAEADGTVEAFADGDLTAYAAPDPSVATLYAMRTLDGETKARYYTEDTALADAADTLADNGFTGYVELSENVLSGDYYLVFSGGRRQECAFVGSSEELLTGEEAFERAADEVGIYEVIDVTVEVIDIPESSDTDDTTGATGATDTTGATGATDASGVAGANGGAGGSGVGDATGDTTGVAGTSDGTGTADATGTADRTGTGAANETGTTDAGAANGGADTRTATADATDTPERRGESTPDTGGGDGPSGASTARGSPDGVSEAEAETAGSGAASGAEPDEAGGANEPTDGAAGGNGQSAATAEREWQQTRTIPSLDPSDSSTDGRPSDPTSDTSNGRTRNRNSGSRTSGSRTGGSRTSGSRTSGSRTSGSRSSGSRTGGSRASDGRSGGHANDTGRSGGGRSSEAVSELKEKLAEAREKRQSAEQTLERVRSELDDREATVERLRSENDQLESRVAELESEVERLESELADVEQYLPEGDQQRSREAALSGTNLFVRYRSKGGATLETAHAGGATSEEVAENLRLETHTDFAADRTVVDGEDYDEFLDGTVEYNFVRWVIEDLLYEIQTTGSESAMRELFDAIPDVDRAELHGEVRVADEEGTEYVHPFDVILRDRMGNPLIVANVTNGLDATSEPAITELIEAATEIGEHADTLGCALHVTASFFEPGALSAVDEATGGGLLSRDKRESFVKLSRKDGFHLALVESREGEFHVTVPEL
ncbi:MAG: hypothetical protein ABEI75_04880 [Halobaculum sp.]